MLIKNKKRVIVMNERHTKILELLTEHKKIEVTKLSELLQVSQVTIRKDLVQLENEGLIVREHGYATINASDDINHRLAYHYDKKQKIASIAASLVEHGETIMIESGSCCALVALQIAKTKKDVTMITNSAFIAEYIRKIGTSKIVLLGGEYQKESQVMVGPITRNCAKMFFVDKLFIGIDGFTKDSGFTGNDYMRCETVRDMAKQATNVIVVSDSVKFGKKSIVSLMKTKEVSMVITDSELSLDQETDLLNQNVEVKKAI